MKLKLEETLNNKTIFGVWENGVRQHGTGLYYNEDINFQMNVSTSNATDIELPIDGAREKIREYMRWQDELKELEIKKNVEEYKFINRIGIIVSLLMIFYVLTKILFNVFATIQLPLDRWSKADVIVASSNIVCFLFLGNIKEEVIEDNEKRAIYNFLQIIVILSTFYRLMLILFVVPKLSQLLVICVAMLGSATTFMIIYFMYTMMMVGLMQTLF